MHFSTTTSKRERSFSRAPSPTPRTGCTRTRASSWRASRAAAERLRRFLHLYVEDDVVFQENWVLWNEMWSSSLFDPDMRPAIEEAYRRWIAFIVDLVEQGRADGSIAQSIDPEEAGSAAGGRGRRDRLAAPPRLASPRPRRGADRAVDRARAQRSYAARPRLRSPRAMMTRWISLVPSQIRSTRSSRKWRSAGYSVM